MSYLLSILGKGAGALGAVSFFVMFASILIQTFFRYALNQPLSWPSELSVYCYIFVTYVGAGIASGKKSHVAFDLIVDRFSKKGRLISDLAGNLFVIVILIILLPSVFSYIKFSGSVKSSAMGISWIWFLISFPIGMGLSVIYLIARAASSIREFFRGAPCL